MRIIHGSFQNIIEKEVAFQFVTDTASLICWSCLERTPPGECVYCGVSLEDPEKAYEDDDNKKYPRLISIKKRNSENVVIDLDQIVAVVTNHFVVNTEIMRNELAFVVADPGIGLDSKFQELLTESQELDSGLISKVERRNDKELKISYFYREPFLQQENRTMILLFVFSVLSVFLAGFFNYSQIELALQRSDSSVFEIFGVIISLESFLHSIQFTGTLMTLLILKDFHLLRSIRNGASRLSPYYIPAPPIFELGTLGSVNRQNQFYHTRGQMAEQLLRWPSLAWLMSVVIILVTLPLASYNPTAASGYSDHSIIANGRFEPPILSLLGWISNNVLGSELDLSQPLTQSYIFHPITLGAFASFYIISFSLLPAAHLTGGFLIRSTFSNKRIHAFFTYLTIFGLVFVHWLLASLLFLIHEMLKSPEILNEESRASNRFILIPFVIILILSFPFELAFLSLY